MQKTTSKRIAIYPGSFDPPTNGHIDVIQRASLIFDKVIISVSNNQLKKSLFSIAERKAMLKDSVRNIRNVEVDAFSGLLVSYLRKKRSRIVIRGLRAVSDFEYEFQMALMNRNLNRSIETVFLMPDEAYTYLSSSIVKEVARLGGSIRDLVPASVEKFLKKKYK